MTTRPAPRVSPPAATALSPALSHAQPNRSRRSMMDSAVGGKLEEEMEDFIQIAMNEIDRRGAVGPVSAVVCGMI